MEQNTRLAAIYVKIYNKQTLTMDDLTFLAKYDPECFTKTCKNLIYNLPETRELMTQEPEEIQMETGPQETEKEVDHTGDGGQEAQISRLLSNLRSMREIPVSQVNPDRVKNLLGSLYMEMLFPHNDKNKYFEMPGEQEKSTFNKKV